MKIKRKLLVMLCALIFLCIGSVCIVAIAEDTSEQSKAIEQVLVDEFLDNVYKVGDVVEMPLLIEDGKEYQRLVCFSAMGKQRLQISVLMPQQSITRAFLETYSAFCSSHFAEASE